MTPLSTTLPLSTRHKTRAISTPRNRNDGFVLIIALIMLGAMALAAVSLVRTLDTSTLLSRNISFKRDAVNRNDVGIEAALTTIRQQSNFFVSNDRQTTDLAKNYSSVMLDTDSEGIPLVMKGAISDFRSTYLLAPVSLSALGISNDYGLKVVYIIERMCSTPGVDTREKCLRTAKEELGGDISRAGGVEVPNAVLYRITTRVYSEGDDSSVPVGTGSALKRVGSFAQTILAAS